MILEIMASRRVGCCPIFTDFQTKDCNSDSMYFGFGLYFLFLSFCTMKGQYFNFRDKLLCRSFTQSY